MNRLAKLEKEVECPRADRQIAERHGLSAWHVIGLREFCLERRLLLILRSSKSASRKFHNKRGFAPKPVDFEPEDPKKTKTIGGRVSGTSKTYPHITNFYSDYDIMCLKKRSGNRYVDAVSKWDEDKVITNEGWEMLKDLNSYIGDSTPFQHGANDQYKDVGSSYMKNEIKADEWFLALDETMRVFEFFDAKALKRFYDKRGIDWQPYQVSV